MPRKTLHFKNQGAYRRWLAFDAIHNPQFGKHRVKVDIAGRSHRVVHSSMAHAHRHHGRHHGGPCNGSCRAGVYTHRHRSGSSARG